MLMLYYMSNKHLKSIAYLIFILVFFISGCGGTSSTKNLSQGSANNYDDFSTGKIKGTVTSYSTGIALSGAIVEAYQCQAITGSDGTYVLDGVPAGDHSVTVRLEGYNATIKNDVRVFNGQVTENINFAMTNATNEYTSDFQVLSITPRFGTDGDQLSVLCSGCGKIPGRVTINGVDAQILDWNSASNGIIKVCLPNNVESGPVKVIIKNETSKEINSVNFIGRPVILSIHPETAVGGQTIVVNGRNFSTIYSYNKFQLNGQECYTINDDSSAYHQKITLPANANTGYLTVKIINPGTYTVEGVGSATLTVAPRLVYISPKRSLPEAPITLYGYNFGTDKSAIKVLLGTYELSQANILSLTDNSLVFKAPSNSIISAGTTVDVTVQINDAQSNSLKYTAYNNINSTITDYGIYDFTTVSRDNKLVLAQLKPTDVIAFISTLSGNYNQSFSDEYSYYVVSAYLGGNTEYIPTLPTSVRTSEHDSKLVVTDNNISVKTENIAMPIIKPSEFLRASVTEPASKTMKFYVRDFTASEPYNAANDKLQSAILAASTTHSLVYLEESITGINQSACLEIANAFDKSYESIATAFGVLNPPEGNVDTQSRIVLFLTEKVDDKPDKSAYFDSRDKQTQQIKSNGTEIIFASPNKYKSSPDEFQAELASALHDMVYYNQRWDNAQAVYYGTDWQCAGLSMMARQVTGRGFNQRNSVDVTRVKNYLNYPEKVSLNTWPAKIVDGNYGIQFLFTQYLFDRCGGWNCITLLESGKSSNVRTGLQDIVLNILPSANPSTNDLSEFFNDFCLALYCDDMNFPTNFTGYNANKYNFKNISLREKGVTGLRGKSLGETPINNVVYQIPGFGCSALVYSGGNWGDLDFEIRAKPDQGTFKTWVIFYSTENTK